MLASLGASVALVEHHRLVLEAARELVVGLEGFAGHFVGAEVLLGASVHDAGKILFPGEMAGPGAAHEEAGARLLRDNGMSRLARFCVSHGQWRRGVQGPEDLLVALADTLWKGKRCEELELRIVADLAAASGRDYWGTMIELDDLFERIADGGPARLARSRIGTT